MSLAGGESRYVAAKSGRETTAGSLGTTNKLFMAIVANRVGSGRVTIYMPTACCVCALCIPQWYDVLLATYTYLQFGLKVLGKRLARDHATYGWHCVQPLRR